jgi:hypothetical protein
VVTLPQRFKQAGYEVVGIGKSFDPRSDGGQRSMDAVSWTEPFINVEVDGKTYSYLNPDIVAHIDRQRAELGKPPKRYDKQLEAIFPGGKPATDRAQMPDNAYHDGVMTDLAIDRLNGFAQSGSRFFLAVDHKKPYLPFNAPEK